MPVKALIDAADPDANIKLTGGEEIRVPEAGKVFVVGNVKRPGAFAVQDGAETSVMKMLAVAEGLAPFAGKQAFIYRREAAGIEKRDSHRAQQDHGPQGAGRAAAGQRRSLYSRQPRPPAGHPATLEKILMFGSTAGATALIYGR